MLEQKSFIRWVNEHAEFVVAHNEYGHETVEGTDGYGEPVNLCTLYEGLTCRDHANAAVDIDNARSDDLVQVPFIELCPNTWLVAPDGTVTQVAEEDQFAAQKLRKRFEAVQEGAGKPLGRKVVEPVRAALARADAAIDEETWADALRHLAGVEKLVDHVPASLDTLIAQRTARIEEQVRWALEDLEGAEEAEAAETLAQVKALLEAVKTQVRGAHLPVRADLQRFVEAHGD